MGFKKKKKKKSQPNCPLPGSDGLLGRRAHRFCRGGDEAPSVGVVVCGGVCGRRQTGSPPHDPPSPTSTPRPGSGGVGVTTGGVPKNRGEGQKQERRSTKSNF